MLHFADLSSKEVVSKPAWSITMLAPRFAILATACALLTAPVAFAAGDEPAPAATASASPKSAKAVGCKRGEVARKDACVVLAAGAIPDEELYEQGKLLATDGEYDWALEALTLITKQDDAKVLNYIGYSHRKAGRLETGIDSYKKALALDPNFVQAREYLGEAYILAGKKDLAMAELAEIKTRCGEACPEYLALEKSLSAN
jgi:tetratricopeptide (TPR) repeat protein